MPIKRSRKNTRSRRSRRGSGPNLRATALAYNGPYKLPGSRQQNTLYTLELRSVLTLSSSVSGVIDQVVDNNPSGYQDWSSIAALWDEFRALSLLVEFKPNNRYSKTTTTVLPWYVVIDRDSNGALSSKNAAIQYESCRTVSLEDFWSYGVKFKLDTAAGSNVWQTTSSPAFTFCVKGYNSGFSTSTSYGDLLITLLIQVRGRN